MSLGSADEMQHVRLVHVSDACECVSVCERAYIYVDISCAHCLLARARARERERERDVQRPSACERFN